MKKIVLILLFNLILSASTNPCMLDVYFGNGVWNDVQEVQISRDELDVFMQKHNAQRFALMDRGVTYDFKYAHNRTHGTLFTPEYSVTAAGVHPVSNLSSRYSLGIVA